MDRNRITALSRSFADTIGARACSKGLFDYDVAAKEIRRLIELVIEEERRDEATSGPTRTEP